MNPILFWCAFICFVVILGAGCWLLVLKLPGSRGFQIIPPDYFRIRRKAVARTRERMSRVPHA